MSNSMVFGSSLVRLRVLVVLFLSTIAAIVLPRPAAAQSMTLSGSVSPRQLSYVGTATYTASASGGDPATTRYAFFRRRPGGTWIPDINAPAWQSSSTYIWRPTLSDVGVWETYIWAKDGTTPANANTYGYAAGVNSQPIEVFGPPTAPGATAVSCDSTAGGNCWVSGDFVISVSASTGGLGSLSYQICRSIDTTGWGGCDVNLTLTGGTSITVSGSHLPADGYQRSYWFLARDSAGALSGWNTPKFVRVDRYAPSVGASNASGVTWYSYRAATVSANDSGSGLQSVRYSWNTALNASCTTGTATSSGATLTAPAGDNVLYLCARDNVGRVAQWSGQYRVSPLTLTGTVSPKPASVGGTVTYTASAGGGTPSTTRFAFFRRRPGGTWIPDVNAPNWQAGNVFTWTPTSADVGTWETYIWVKDGDTPSGMSTYGYAAGVNPQPIDIIGPPTVPGPTTVACVYTVAATGDCWVTGDFTASVTPSTGGAGSLVYEICRSNDSAGGFAGCEASLTLSGGTSILISGTNLPSDGYRRSYWFLARDSAGAKSGWNVPQYVRVDRYAPTVAGGNASALWYSYRTATVSASDGQSGLKSVRYSWNAALDANCTTGTATSPGAALTVPSGDNLLYLCAKDNTGRVAQWSGQYRVSPLTLTGTVSPKPASAGGTVTYTASAGGGTPSTTRFAFFRRRQGSSAWIPDVNAPNWQAGNVFTWVPGSADVGTWDTYIWVKDGDTPATMSTYGYAAGFNTGPIDIVGPPTVPGPTTVACAYTEASSGDCWVKGDFTASVTASTGGSGSLVYQICRSNDATTSFAGCDVNLTLTGGTSILVSGAHLPGDGFRRSYWFQAKDPAGALSGWNTPRYVRVDRYAPTLSASNASDTVWYSSRTATVAASDSGSGVQAVRYAWNTALDANCTTGTATSAGAALTAPSGDNVLYLCAKDNTGRVAQWTGRYRVSPLTLTGTVSPKPASYLGTVTYTASAGGGTPATTRYAFFRRQGSGAWIPDVTAPNWQAGNTFVWTPTASDVGTWETYIWVKDGDTPAGMNNYGYAAGFNTGPVDIVGKPTVPGPTTVSCAYTTADDCWVAGDFTASVTASTGGTGSLVYQICRSNDSAGGFAGCETNLTLTGGTSFLVSGANLPGDGFRRSYWFQAKDTAGALSGWNTPRYVRVDRAAPSVSAGNASDSWFSSRTATVAASDTGTGGSGLQAVRYSWNTALDAGCTTGTATATGSTLTAPSGDNVLYLCAKDNVGRVAQWNGRYRVAAQPTLTVTPSPAKSSYLTTLTWTVTASGGVPGTLQYAFVRRKLPSGAWIPDVTTPSWQTGNVFTWKPDKTDAGSWEFFFAVKDSLTAPNANTYGYAAGVGSGPTEIVGPPAVPGATTVACAYSAADDCWVAGDFTASVTASTGGMGSLVYQICRSNDSAGGFAGCETNLTLTGGTSILVSGANLPGDGFRRSYWFQAKDSAGALSGWNAPRYVRVDRNAPTVSANNASDQWLGHRAATVSAADVTGGAGVNSGLAGVRYSWNTTLDAACATGTTTAPGAALDAPTGDNVLYLCARDNAGRVAQWNGRYRVTDDLTLTGTVTPRRGSYLGTFTWTASATGGNPATTTYAFFRRRPNGTWIPDVNAPNWQPGNSWIWHPTLDDVGTWETYIWVRDGNTPADAHIYGYAAGVNTQPIEVVGPPTAPGATTVSCAYTTADDCWVTGDFTASVAASTGGMDPLVYRICRSNDSAGGSAVCAADLTLAGGTSIVVSGAHLPGDGFRRSYWFQAKDSAGALSGWNTPRYVRVDRYAPGVGATNASDEWFLSRTATVLAADDDHGAGANSGLAEVRYNWNAALGAGCTGGTATSPGAVLTAPDGDNVLNLCVRDNAGRVGQWSGRYRVGEEPDFLLSVDPATATIVKGGTARFTVGITAGPTFSRTPTLSVSGLPAGASHTLTPTVIGPDETAALTVVTTTSTPQGTYPITVKAVAGDLTRTVTASLVVRAPYAPGAPVIDSITPELFDGGQVKTITLRGKNFQGATVTIPIDDPDPDNPTPRSFPTVSQTTVSADGTRIDVVVDCTDPALMDFYELEVNNGVGKDASHAFRVIPAGPVVDLVTPNRPEVGEDHVYVLSLAGYHLRGTSVHAEPAGVVDVFGIDAIDDTHINGLLRVHDDAPLGPVDLVVRDSSGREARITIEVMAAGEAQVATQEIKTRRIDLLTGELMAGPSPSVLFQRFAVREPDNTEITSTGMHVRTNAAPKKRSASSITFAIYFSYQVRLFDFTWSRAFTFDPVTGRIGDEVLQGLGLGDRVRFGAFVLSFHLEVDLTISVYISNNGFTWPRFCISIVVALQIPGLDGFFERWNFCGGGQFVPFRTGNTSSLNARGGECAAVTQEGPATDGLIFAEAEQRDCCSQPIEVTGEGVAFTGSWFPASFQVNTPNAGTTTPTASCSIPTCPALQTPQPACVIKDNEQALSAAEWDDGGTFQWRVTQGGSHATISGSATGKAVSIRGDQTSQAADDVEVEVVYTKGTRVCTQKLKMSVVEVEAAQAGDPLLDFRDSNQADTDNSVRNSYPSFGMPELGLRSPGNPAGTVGFSNNMEIKAKIAPCDANLRCNFDFKRTREGVVAQVASGGQVSFLDIDCENGNCDDDPHDTDEDLTVDATPGCGIFVIDVPGVGLGSQTGACSGATTDVVNCLNFQEWLEVDGVSATPDLTWHAATRIHCDTNAGRFVRDSSAGAGNDMGTGHVDCSRAAALPEWTPPTTGGTAAAPAISSPRTAMETVARLTDSDVAVRTDAYDALLAKVRRGDLQGEERLQVVTGLVAQAGGEAPEGEFQSGPLLAMQLLGELRAGEAVPVLIDRLLDEFARPIASSADMATPAAQALAKIGAPAIAPLLDLAAGAGDDRWFQARMSLALMSEAGRVREAATARLAAGAEGREEERLRALLDVLRRP